MTITHHTQATKKIKLKIIRQHLNQIVKFQMHNTFLHAKECELKMYHALFEKMNPQQYITYS